MAYRTMIPTVALTPIAIAFALLMTLSSPAEIQAQNCECECSIDECSACAVRAPCYAICVPASGECGACVFRPIQADGPVVSVKGDSEAVSRVLSDALQVDVQFRVDGPGVPELEFKEVPIWRAMESLSQKGELTLNGVPLATDRESDGTTARFSDFLDQPVDLQIEGANPQQISNLLTERTGVHVRLSAAQGEVSMEAKWITGRQLLDTPAKQGELTVAGIAWPAGRPAE